MNMKVKAMITFLFMVYGVIIGINIEPDRSAELPTVGFNLTTETNAQEVMALQEETEVMRQRVAVLKAEIEAMETERAADNVVLQQLLDDVQQYQMLAGHKTVKGPGVGILLEGIFEENIAPLVFQRKYLITLINELRTNGAEVVSVNDHRITGRSELALAGNHIMVNGRPVAPPYQVRAIGNIEAYKRYMDGRTFLFELMASDGIVATVTYEDEMIIAGPQREKTIRFLEVDQ